MIKYRRCAYIVTAAAVFLTCVLACLTGSSQNVILNEICIKNKTVIYDSVGDYSDYIEIYNPSGQKINLEGYAVSDTKNDLRRYEFPAMTIDGKQYLTVWAKGETGELDETGAVYLGFSLKAGETVYLSAPSGEVIDSVTLPDTGKDLSYARQRFTRRWVVEPPSPNEGNGRKKEPEYIVSGKISKPVFSRQAGFYDDPFYLGISADEGTDIYYTVNGEKPTVDSIKYNSEIYLDDVSSMPNVYSVIDEIAPWEVYIPEYAVDKVNTVRAVAVDRNGFVSQENVATYFIGYNDKDGYDDMMKISLITDPGNLFSAGHGIYVRGNIWENNVSKQNNRSDSVCTNYNKEGIGWERPAHMELFDGRNNPLGAQSVGIRIHGRTSTNLNQKSFNVYLRPEYDRNYRTFENVIGSCEHTFMLRAGGGFDASLTKIRDVLNQGLVSDRNVTTQNYKPCQVFLNGECWGVYNLQERVCSDLIASNYKIDENNIILLKNRTVIEGSSEDLALYTDIVSFAEDNDLSADENYDAVLEQIDIQSYIDYYCFQIYVANSDSVGNNYALWRTRKVSSEPYCDGKWRWILYDTDESADIPAVSALTNPAVNSFSEGHWGNAPLDDVLFSSLIKNARFKAQFVKTFMDLANYNFSIRRTDARIDYFYDLYHEAVVLSHQRFVASDYAEQDYLNEINRIRTFYHERYEHIVEHMKKELGLGTANMLELQESGISGGTLSLNTLTMDSGESFSGAYFSDYPVLLSAKASDGYRFAGWEIDGHIYSEEPGITLDMDSPHKIKAHWEKKND